ncbi:MAG TPA: type I-E CRISPR-associated protein Cas6/Cse3/CasE, partial [Gammaproteobacteria bacterium]|nr:type I-E CRISPR-associated protein Cas6/Cse3/CasE [Gammaproteobacteria bacterium]
MYFSRIRLRTDADTGILARQLCEDDSYREHQMLWRLFSDDPNTERDFLFRRDDYNSWPQFYLVSQRTPEGKDGVWQIDERKYQPKLFKGEKLAFSLRANPVITRKDSSGKHKRHDLVMDIKIRSDWRLNSGSERKSLYELTQMAGETWLSPRLERNGGKLETLNTEGYQQHKTSKRGLTKPIQYSSLDLTGILSVTDPDVFTQTLYRGLGPAKALGCDLL